MLRREENKTPQDVPRRNSTTRGVLFRHVYSTCHGLSVNDKVIGKQAGKKKKKVAMISRIVIQALFEENPSGSITVPG